MISEMPFKAVARIVGEHDTRLWRIARHYVNETRAAVDHSGVRAVGDDEKSSPPGAAAPCGCMSRVILDLMGRLGVVVRFVPRITREERGSSPHETAGR